MNHKVSFFILTGFLGAGKTTVLNEILTLEHSSRIAVLVNELGRISIDTKMILQSDDDVLELAGGCVCCAIDIKNDLWNGIDDVISRSNPDHVILETTGIAEPSAIINGFQYLEKTIAEKIQLAGIICVVDVTMSMDEIRPEILDQIQSADRILLSKVDKASAKEIQRVHQLIAKINATSEVVSFPKNEIGKRNMSNWILEIRPPQKIYSLSNNHHKNTDHLGQITAVSFSDNAPLVAETLMTLIESMKKDFLRIKGCVFISGKSQIGYLELAGKELSLRYGNAWGKTLPKTELVFIGDSLDEAALQRKLWSCRTACADS